MLKCMLLPKLRCSCVCAFCSMGRDVSVQTQSCTCYEIEPCDHNRATKRAVDCCQALMAPCALPKSLIGRKLFTHFALSKGTLYSYSA